ncbi:MAG: primosomal protein N' [Erysipelotrichaceae bacterium]|nr:primosomal protein N' [Erysipelotrichaceae bacterium]
MLIEVLIELKARAVDKYFTYKVPVNLINKVKVGVRVIVPFAYSKLMGFVTKVNVENTSDYEIKEILDVVDTEVILTDELLELGKYLKEKTLATLISCYQVMLPNGYKASKKKINKKYETYITVNIDKLKDVKLSDKQQDIVNILLKNKQVSYSYLKKINSSVDTLIKNGVLVKEKVEVYRLNNNYRLKEKYALTPDQEKVYKQVDLDKFQTYLLYGVTGSGKTEVYMELIEDVIKKGKEAIVLIPEISLTPQTVRRFIERFGQVVAVLHSGLSDSEKYDEYRKIRKGEVKIVIGARSAIFAPLENIGIIVVDEEHSTSYKQENMPRYDAILVAKKRGEYHNCPVILGSATPTLESFSRTLKNVYTLLKLEKRVNNRSLPEVEIIDMMKAKKKTKFFSETLYEKINSTLQKGEQVILFLNKRGYATTISCKNCGKTFTCKNCDITLTYHKSSEMLRCHYCGYAELKPKVCPNCQSELELNGIGTEQIEEELNTLFPDYKTIRMDFDTTSKKGSHEKIIELFRNNEYQILVGTQMIAKGLDFSNVTLVGVINADGSLNIPDFRSSETTFDLLNQVSGRAGRGEKKGYVYIQTFNPNHYAILYAKNNNYLGFFQNEMKNRHLLNYPPYCYLALIILSATDYNYLGLESKKIKEYLKINLKTEILGPSLANPFRVNKIYRMNIIIKYKKENNIYEVLNNLINHYKINDKLRIDIDFNPRSF